MLFNSYAFGVFFIVVLALYYGLRSRLRGQCALLLVASYVFYGWWDPRFLFLILASSAVDYVAGLMIDRGVLTGRQRWKVSAAFVLGSLTFVGLDFDAIDWLSLQVDWHRLLSLSAGQAKVVGTVTGLTLAANLLYPAATRLPEAARRKLFIAVSVCANLGCLAVFKYFDFFIENFEVLLSTVAGHEVSLGRLQVVLPVGISFYTFQTMSYSIDVYRRQLKATSSFLNFAAYVSFFPQLVAGPIERGARLLPQFEAPRPRLTREAWRSGLWLIFWGLYKKIVVADNMATIANAAFAPFDGAGSTAEVPSDGLRMLLGVYAFAFQIYGDFSGYTDIARGTARLMGFDLMLNFRLPYFAISPSDFWRRWHISLSTWLRDYLYISLGGNRGGSFFTYRNLVLTMLLGGLWHGASWTFIIWGAYHGAILVLYRIGGDGAATGQRRAWSLAWRGLLMFHLTCLGWLIFRAQNVRTIGVFLESIALSPRTSPEFWEALHSFAYFAWFLVGFQVVQGVTGKLDPLKGAHWFVRLNVWIFIIMSLFTLAVPGVQEFIYFAF